MKKRFLSILLTICMVLTLVPTTVIAQTQNSIALTKTYLQNNSYVLTGGSTESEMTYFYLDEDIDIDRVITVKGYVNLDINGHILKNPNFLNVIAIGDSSTNGNLTIRDSGSGLITGALDTFGGIIEVNSGSSFTFKSGNIRSENNLTAIYIARGATMALTGGTIDGIVNIKGGTLYAHDGKISGDVVNINGEITRSDENITTATSFEGCVYNGGTIKWGNFANDVYNSFFNQSFYDYPCSGTISGGRFEGTVTNGYQKPSPNSPWDNQTGTIAGGTFLNGISEVSGLSVISNTDSIILGVKHGYEIVNANNNGYGGVILTSDILCDEYFSLLLHRDFIIDLNGHVMDLSGVFASSAAITVDSGCNLTLLDSNPNATHKFTPNGDGVWVLDEENGIKTVNGGVITGFDCSSRSNQGRDGVIVISFGKFTMNGGSIVGCQGAVTGAINVKADNSIFYFNGGSIIGCKSTDAGGAVYIGENANMYMNGGTISDNISDLPGGNNIGVFVFGTIYANGGVIDDDVFNFGTITRSDDATDYTTFYGNVIMGQSGMGTIVEDKAKLTVTFDSNGGSAVATQKVLKGQKLASVSAPTKENFNFEGWYNGENKWNFNDSVMDNMTLTAKWSCAGHKDVNPSDHKCDFCGETSSQCTGGEATCTDKAVCEICGEEYGDLDPTTHSGKLVWTTKNATRHEQKWNCCGKVTVSLENHEWENGICKECEYPCVHDYNWHSENGQYWQRCSVCGLETAKKDIPEITIIGADKVCKTQDYTFTFTFSEEVDNVGNAFISSIYEIELNTTYLGNGVYSCTLNHEIIDFVFENGVTTFSVTAGANTKDGYPFIDEKIVEIQGNHTGGEATCTDKAICEICGEEYGELDANNHTGDKGWNITPNRHEQLWDCCGKTIVEIENHEWENGVCTECDTPCLHDYQWQNENGQYWQKCTVCGLETEKSDVPQIIINGNDTVCQGHDWTFTFTLPDGSTDVVYGYDFELKGDSGLTPVYENGVYTITISPDLIENENSFKLSVYAKTADGFDYSSNKEITIISDHTGGTATCTDKAVCEICGDEYGELDPTNHASGLKHVEKVEATTENEGNTEYWFCEDCGKYYSDENGENEITLADTIIQKLEKPVDKDEVPNTGNSHTLLWILLAITTCGTIGVGIWDKKKKTNR